MKITIAPDSFKESLPSPAAAQAIARGLAKADPAADLILAPMADGGEGTLEAMVEATAGFMQKASVADPLGRPVNACWGLSGDGRTAFVEMAEASGLELLKPAERNPMLTSTRGTGELIRCALSAGVDKIVVGIGGSATVDGGVGMALALGARFLDADHNPITSGCGGQLRDIADLDLSGLDERLRGVQIVVACDVTNPLVGPDGAARTYGPQKGATPEQVEELERGLENLAAVIRRRLGVDVAHMPGAGAAGGLGAGLVAFLGASLQEGARTVMEAIGLPQKMQGSALVITGEGRMDWQSAFGKATAAVAREAKRQGVPAVALVGSLGPGYEKMYEAGLTSVFSILDRPMDLATALAQTELLLERSAESVLRLWLSARTPSYA